MAINLPPDGISIQETHKDYVNASSFDAWLNEILNTQEPTQIPTCLYYGFQPLFDLSVNPNASRENRQKARRCFVVVNRVAKRYLQHFYVGKPNITDILELERLKKCLPTSEYRTKRRNIPNTISSNDVLGWLRKITSCTQVKPDLIVGCACGAAEPVQALSAITDIPSLYIRMSHRRDDDKPVIHERDARILRKFCGKSFLVVEDYICSGMSARKIVDYLKTLSDKILITSIKSTYHQEGMADFVTLIRESGFHLYKPE